MALRSLLRRSAIAPAVLAFTACVGTAQPAGDPALGTTSNTSPASATATPQLTQSATAVASGLSVTPLPAPPSPTPIPALPLRIAAQLDPPTPRAGQEFVLALTVSNDGSRATRGIYIATNGPWERWSVIGVQPSGVFGRDAAGWHIVSAIEIPPGDARTVEVHVRAQEPAEEQLTFAAREAEPGELPR